jgi:hypothetical protein
LSTESAHFTLASALKQQNSRCQVNITQAEHSTTIKLKTNDITKYHISIGTGNVYIMLKVIEPTTSNEIFCP